MDIFVKIDRLQNEINQFRPLDNHLINQIKEYFRVGLTYASNAIEGNTLTESETKVVLEEGITIGGKPLRDHMEALGHSQAFDFLLSCAQKDSIDEQDIKELDRLFYYRIDIKKAGVYRREKVFITGSKYAVTSPELIDEQMSLFINNLQQMKRTMHPVEFAAKAHKDFVFIHPFIDGNGRIARLLMNLILLQAGYTITIVPPVVRHNYILALEKAHVNDAEFIELIARMVKETQQDWLRLFV